MQNLSLSPAAGEALTKGLSRASHRLEDALAIAAYITAHPDQHPPEMVARAERRRCGVWAKATSCSPA
jgi:hypothetical protein